MAVSRAPGAPVPVSRRAGVSSLVTAGVLSWCPVRCPEPMPTQARCECANPRPRRFHRLLVEGQKRPKVPRRFPRFRGKGCGTLGGTLGRCGRSRLRYYKALRGTALLGRPPVRPRRACGAVVMLCGRGSGLVVRVVDVVAALSVPPCPTHSYYLSPIPHVLHGIPTRRVALSTVGHGASLCSIRCKQRNDGSRAPSKSRSESHPAVTGGTGVAARHPATGPERRHKPGEARTRASREVGQRTVPSNRCWGTALRD